MELAEPIARELTQSFRFRASIRKSPDTPDNSRFRLIRKYFRLSCKESAVAATT